jgi:hypothetical protein
VRRVSSAEVLAVTLVDRELIHAYLGDRVRRVLDDLDIRDIERIDLARVNGERSSAPSAPTIATSRRPRSKKRSADHHVHQHDEQRWAD